jgi:hypothetical protein
MNRKVRVAFGVVAASVAVAIAGSASASSGSKGNSSYPIAQNIGPRYTTSGGASVLPTTQTVPHWNGSFVDGLSGLPFGFNMAGSDPSSGTSTTVTTEIIPVSFAFAADGGTGFSAGQAAAEIAQSPIFQPTALPSGETTQWLDAVMRAQFDAIGSGYHVNLANTAVLPAQTLVVPQNQGAIYQTDNGTPYGLASFSWFAAQLQQILNTAKVSPTTLPIVVSDNTYLYPGSLANCCILGFHGAGKVPGQGGGSIHGNGSQAVQTYAWASWIPSSDIFGPGFTDTVALSHEIAEWGDDPFVDNFVSPWSSPGGCGNLLETGDPLVGVNFAAGSTNPDPGTGPAWHLQDEANLWWFAHEASQAANGAYSYLGTLTSPAPGC